MKLVRLTYSANDDPPVYINPEHVAAVRSTGANTLIQLAASGADGALSYYLVREPVDLVVHMLTEE